MMFYRNIVIFVIVVSTTKCQNLQDGILIYGYNLHLNFSRDSFTKAPYEYQGYLRLPFVMYSSYSTDLKMYAAHDFIKVRSAFLEIESNLTTLSSFNIDDDTDILTLRGSAVVRSRVYYSYLNINFTSRLSVTDLYGVYKSSYVSNGETKYFVATQLEPTFARRMFPCFDELTYKTSFRLNITHPSEMKVNFNTPEDKSVNSTDTTDSTYITSYYERSGDMETYMMGFTITPKAEFTCTIGENISTSMELYRVCSRIKTESFRNWALEVGPPLMRELNNFTNFKYGLRMGFPKMDLVAIPNLVTSSTENWGLITLREQNLLIDEENSSAADKQNVAQMITYEFSQMWFGNLASFKWWNFSYITKGLAYYLQSFIIDRVMDGWELNNQFIYEVFQPSLAMDSYMFTPDLRSKVNSTQEIMEKLNKFTHLKGAILYRMVKEVIGNYECFQKGLEYFITSFAKRNAIPQHMWNLISAQINLYNRNLLPGSMVLRDVLIGWEENPGFPLLEVTKNGSEKLIVKQKGRFLFRRLDKQYEWYVPVSYTFSSNVDDFENTTLNQWLMPNSSVEIDLPTENEDWVILNNQATGYYRVNYGDMWQNISTAIQQPNFSGIPILNRAQLLDDLFALARAGIVRYSVAFNFIKYLDKEKSLYPWMAVFRNAQYILNRVGRYTNLGLKIKNFLLNLMTNVYNTVPWNNVIENNHIYTIKQIKILSEACSLGYLDCVQNAVNLFQEFKTTGKRPQKDLRSIVYCTGMLYSSNKSDFDMLWKAFQTTDLATEKVKTLSALGCTENKVLLERSLGLTLNNTSGINTQDASIVFTSVYSHSNVGANLALNFLIENYHAIVKAYQDMNGLHNMVLGLADHLIDKTQLAQLRSFLQNTADLPEELRLVSNQALEIIDVNEIWLERHLDELNQYFQTSKLLL